MSSIHGRRSFISAIGSLAGVAVVQGGGSTALAQAPAAGGVGDFSWLDALKGRHKQVYDYGSVNLAAEALPPLRYPRNYLNSFRDVNRLEFPDVCTAVGISAQAFPMNASDRLWQKYQLGERFKIMDPTTKKPAVRNVFLSGGEFSVTAMQARGTVFWQCDVALGFLSQQFADAFKLPVAEVRADVIAGLNPMVHVVSSHVMALGLAQERGFTYVKA